MGSEFSKLEHIRDIMALHGRELAIALVILIVGLYLAKWLTGHLKIGLGRLTKNANLISIVSNIFYILFLFVVIIAATTEVGFKTVIIFRFLMVVSLAAIGVMVLFLPFIPTLPLKLGNTVKVADLLGKVEATTFLNTRLKTFDGKTVFVPNRQILNDIVINYHFTKTRRIKVDVQVRYDQDILTAKRIMESIMLADPRVKKIPRPVVYTLALEDSWVKLGARCWVDNPKFWFTRCDLIEKVKYGFENEGIRIAFPQVDVHHYDVDEPIEFPAEDELA
ncbi:MAG: mechanosensitive ion channel family protein [Deltaproteobacteria bacterium]|nr:mechanosensitive ion channel family protein [Deltaproteobacteria bacterium]